MAPAYEICVGLKKGHRVTANTPREEAGKQARENPQRITNSFARFIREIVGYAPYERRIVELLKNLKDKRAVEEDYAKLKRINVGYVPILLVTNSASVVCTSKLKLGSLYSLYAIMNGIEPGCCPLTSSSQCLTNRRDIQRRSGLHNLVNKRVMYAFCRRAVNPASRLNSCYSLFIVVSSVKGADRRRG
uniref:60S ribosomal protein L36 n=1 Tax=Macrostomum lignano TaxID=282301 RepID=A0A1I8JQF1_9PLAT